MFSPPPLPSFSNPFAELLSASGGKIALTPESTSGLSEFAFLLNPTQFSIDRAVSWDDSKAMKEPYGILSFTGGSSDTLNFTTMIDATENGSKPVLPAVRQLYAMTDTSVKEANYNRPPIIKLVWKDVKFVGVITSLKFDFTMFSEDGDPLRANVTISMMGRSFNDDASADSFFAPFNKGSKTFKP